MQSLCQEKHDNILHSHNSDPGLGSILTCEIMINEKLDPGKQGIPLLV